MKITFILSLVLVAGIAFYAGNRYGQNQSTIVPVTNDSSPFGSRTARGGTRMSGGGGTSGEIITKNDQNIAIKVQGGGSRIIFYSDSSEIGKFVKATAEDLQIGQSVTVSGTENQDGSMIAQKIQIRPADVTRAENVLPPENLKEISSEKPAQPVDSQAKMEDPIVPEAESKTPEIAKSTKG